jgi:hypothetical protein
VAGDPLGEWRPSTDEGLDEWAERQQLARQPPEPPEGRFDTALWIIRAVFAVVVVVLIVVYAVFEAL